MITRTQPLVAVAPRPLDDLEGDAGDERDAEDAREDEDPPGGQPERREDEDGHDHHEEQEARAAAGVQAREARGVLRGQLLPGLVAGDGLVLGAVVLEHPPQVTQAGEQQRGSRGRSRSAGSPSTSQNRIEEPSWSLIRLVRPTGTRKNRPTARIDGDEDGADPRPAGDLLLLPAAGRWPRCRAP